jgi:hypothetical protein
MNALERVTNGLSTSNAKHSSSLGNPWGERSKQQPTDQFSTHVPAAHEPASTATRRALHPPPLESSLDGLGSLVVGALWALAAAIRMIPMPRDVRGTAAVDQSTVCHATWSVDLHTGRANEASTCPPMISACTVPYVRQHSWIRRRECDDADSDSVWRTFGIRSVAKSGGSSPTGHEWCRAVRSERARPPVHARSDSRGMQVSARCPCLEARAGRRAPWVGPALACPGLVSAAVEPAKGPRFCREAGYVTSPDYWPAASN